MKTLTNIFVLLFIAYFFRVEIAKYQINKVVNEHTNEIEFVGSLMPVYCQLEKIQNNFKHNTDNLTAFTQTIETTTNQQLPVLEQAIANVQPYNDESQQVKMAIENLYEVSAAETREMNTLINSWQQSDSFLDVLVAGFQTYNFANDLDNATQRIERNKTKVENATEEYMATLTTELSQEVKENAWVLMIADKVFTRKDKALLANYTTEQVFNEINKTTYLQSGCAKEQLHRLRSQLGF